MNYSFIEHKLRRFIYLGHKNSIYVHPTHQKTFWKSEKDHYKFIGVKFIQNIIKKNKTEDINSIVPIILKIEKEKKLENYEYLIYILAVCSKFQKDECQKLISDAYAAVRIICTDGKKLLMFYVFCNTAAQVLYKQGCIPKESLGYGNGARKIFSKWYLERNPFDTISSIIKQKKFRGFSHKNIMNTIHLSSNDPSHQIYIMYIRFGLSKMEEIYGQRMQKKIDNHAIKSLVEQRCIYNYIRLVHRINLETDSKWLSNLKWNILGKDFEVVLPKMLQSTRVLTSFIWHLPLTTLLANTYTFYRHGLFKNLRGNQGCMEFILRFKDHIAVKKSGIHPIDSYLEYLKYERYGAVISALKRKKENNQNMFFDPTEVEPKSSVNFELRMKKGERKLKKSCKKLHNNSHLFFMKPVPSPIKKLQKFLSIDLMEKTLKNLTSSGRQLLIAYDNRISMESVACQYNTHVKFVKVIDAIVLIIQSIVCQERSNKPTICALFDPVHRIKFIRFNYQLKLTTKYFQKFLFEKPPRNGTIRNMGQSIRPLNTIYWAKKQGKIVDVFLFLGTAEMNLRDIRKTKADYEAYSNSKIKIIICCLNGKHSERENISRDGMLYIFGFDKNTIRIINLFINDTF